ncbi:MAG: hypothetical protein INR71_12925, partial [Terriglobus roseus]|nr:hypothetical protein [Terriglobus roseus]
YLHSLQEALLLADPDFSKELRQLLLHLENLAAQTRRLQGVHTNLDLEEDDGVVDGLNDWRAEERAVELELDRARKKVDEGLRACVDALARLDAGAGVRPTVLPMDGNGVGFARGGGTRPKGGAGWKWKAPGVDRLLMKLEFGRADNLPASGDEDGP